MAALFGGRLNRGRAALTSISLNLVTHPLAYVVLRGEGLSWWVVELAVIAVEAAGYRAIARLAWTRALLVSCVCNAATMSVSHIIG